MATATDLGILTLSQWVSPAYPVGSFAYSHGLEWAVESGAVNDAATARVYIRDVLEYGAGRSDALFVALAAKASESALAELDATVRAFAASKERLMETELQGRAFCEVTSAIWGDDLPDLTYPIAFGRAVALHGFPVELATQMYLHAFVSNLAAAATRAVPLGQTEGQDIIHALTPLVRDIAVAVQDENLNDLSATAYLSDIAAMNHETQYSRIFRT